MTATYTNNQDGTSTLDFSYTHPTQKVLDTAEDAAHYLWLKGYGPQSGEGDMIPLTWNDLTNGQRLTILSDHLKRVMVDAAKTYYVNSAIDAARADAQDDDIFVE